MLGLVWVTLPREKRYRSNDGVDGGEAVGNSSGRAPLGGSKMEATTGWTEGKLWEIELGESSVGKERDGSDDRVDGAEAVGNSLACKASVCKAPVCVNVFCV